MSDFLSKLRIYGIVMEFTMLKCRHLYKQMYGVDSRCMVKGLRFNGQDERFRRDGLNLLTFFYP